MKHIEERDLQFAVGKLVSENKRLRNRLEAVAEAAFDIRCWLQVLYENGSLGWQAYRSMDDSLDCMGGEGGD